MFTELATAHDKTVTLGPLALGFIGMIHLQALVLDVLRRSKSGNRPCNRLINIKFSTEIRLPLQNVAYTFALDISPRHKAPHSANVCLCYMWVSPVFDISTCDTSTTSPPGRSKYALQ